MLVKQLHKFIYIRSYGGNVDRNVKNDQLRRMYLKQIADALNEARP